MKDIAIRIPKFLHEIHGEQTRLSTLFAVYVAGIAAAAVFYFQVKTLPLPGWKAVLASMVMLDLAAGVVANLSTSTNRYYQGKGKIRVLFLLLHVFHPACFAFVFLENAAYFASIGVYTVVTGMLVNALHDTERQQNMAALLVVIGIVFSLCFTLPLPVLYAFGPLFMVKLLLGFSVRRPSFLVSRQQMP